MKKDKQKTREQLIRELEEMRQRIIELEAAGSESQRAEVQLRELLDFDQKIIDGVGDQVLVIDARNYDVTRANKAAHEQTGLRGIEKQPVKCYQQFHNRDTPCEKPAEPCPLSRVIAEQKPARVVHVHKDKEGNKMYVEIVATPVFGEDGSVVQIIESSRDITERIALEEEQEKLISELQGALAQIKTLKGLIPVCAWCNRVRDDRGYWESLEDYIREHSEADFTHGICPRCMEEMEEESD